MNQKYLMGPLMEEAGEGSGDGGGTAQLDIAGMQARIDELQTQISAKDASVKDLEETARYWADKAKETGKPSKAAAPALEEEEEEDVLAIAAKGGKAFQSYLDKQLSKKGFVSADKVEAMVNSKAGQMMREADLTKQYPELADAKSDFFKATAAEYQSLKRDGVPEHRALQLAAHSVELEQLRSGTRKTPNAAKEAERIARIAAQGGDTSRGGKDGDGGDDTLSAAQLRMCEEMEIDPKQYQARAKAGVIVSKH